MRHLKFLPLAFIAGVHGFAILAPYLGLCAAVHALSVQRRRRALRLGQIASMNVGMVRSAEPATASSSPL